MAGAWSALARGLSHVAGRPGPCRPPPGRGSRAPPPPDHGRQAGTGSGPSPPSGDEGSAAAAAWLSAVRRRPATGRGRRRRTLARRGCEPALLGLGRSRRVGLAGPVAVGLANRERCRRAAAACPCRSWASRSRAIEIDSRPICAISNATCAASDRPGRRPPWAIRNAAARSAEPPAEPVTSRPRRSRAARS